jgi:hypothetical protein
MAQVSVAWSLSKEGAHRPFSKCTGINFSEGVSAPIVGTTSLANLAEAIGKHIRWLLMKTRTEIHPMQPQLTSS